MCQKQPYEFDVYILDLSQVFMLEKENPVTMNRNVGVYSLLKSLQIVQ